MTSAGVLDTSIFIAQENGRRLDVSLVPDEVATTVVTVAELNLGVLAAVETRINHLWIAAIAGSRGLPVVTQDDDFDPLDDVAGLTIIRV